MENGRYIGRLCPDKPVTSSQWCGSRQRPGTAALQRGGGGLITSIPDTQRLCLGPQCGLQHCSGVHMKGASLQRHAGRHQGGAPCHPQVAAARPGLTQNCSTAALQQSQGENHRVTASSVHGWLVDTSLLA